MRCIPCCGQVESLQENWMDGGACRPPPLLDGCAQPGGAGLSKHDRRQFKLMNILTMSTDYRPVWCNQPQLSEIDVMQKLHRGDGAHLSRASEISGK
jgi:hypothetical protein